MDGLFAFVALIESKLTPARRRKIYQLAVVVGGILTAKQLITADDVAQYLTVLAIVLGTGVPALAARNTPKP